MPVTLRRLAICTLFVLTLAARPAGADEARPAAEPAKPAPNTVRVAVTARAAEALSASRLRRLLDLQLGGAAAVANEPHGPLDEEAVRVFIDLPTPTVTVIQVQAPGRRLDMRRLDVSGLPWDAATRFVAIATSESVRLQLRPLPLRKPKPPSDAELARRVAEAPSVEFSSSLIGGSLLSDAPLGLLGTRGRLSLHQRYLSGHLSVGVAGATNNGSLVETDLSLTHRVLAGPDLRLQFGGGIAVGAAADLASPASGELQAIVRAHGALALGGRLSEGAWLSVELEPGVLINATGTPWTQTSDSSMAPALLGGVTLSFDSGPTPNALAKPTQSAQADSPQSTRLAR